MTGQTIGVVLSILLRQSFQTLVSIANVGFVTVIGGYVILVSLFSAVLSSSILNFLLTRPA